MESLDEIFDPSQYDPIIAGIIQTTGTMSMGMSITS